METFYWRGDFAHDSLLYEVWRETIRLSWARGLVIAWMFYPC